MLHLSWQAHGGHDARLPSLQLIEGLHVLAMDQALLRRPSRGKMPAGKRKLRGLAEDWERNDGIRRSVLWSGRILVWKGDNVGMASYDAAKANIDVLRPLFQRWVARCKTPRAMSVEAIQPQAPMLAHNKRICVYKLFFIQFLLDIDSKKSVCESRCSSFGSWLARSPS